MIMTFKQKKKQIKRLLVRYREHSIAKLFPDRKSGLLRKEMLHLFVEKQPTTRQEFLALFPFHSRERTDVKQMKFLDDVLEIIEEVVFGV